MISRLRSELAYAGGLLRVVSATKIATKRHPKTAAIAARRAYWGFHKNLVLTSPCFPMQYRL